jgi:hypothetical protein
MAVRALLCRQGPRRGMQVLPFGQGNARVETLRSEEGSKSVRLGEWMGLKRGRQMQSTIVSLLTFLFYKGSGAVQDTERAGGDES